MFLLRISRSYSFIDIFLPSSSYLSYLFYISYPILFSPILFQVVKAIAGEDGVAVCRSLLDGIEDDGEGELQSRVTEGRCTGKQRS